MKPLTARQAYSCEHANGPKCMCRCHGAAHGKGRLIERPIDSEPWQLSEMDPHYAKEPRDLERFKAFKAAFEAGKVRR